MRDETDKSIVFHLLKDGRISQKRLAKLIGITESSLSYRINNLKEEGIIKGFSLFVNPNLLNSHYAFLAFPNTKSFDSENVFMKFTCLEEFNVYGVQAKREEFDQLLSSLSDELGEPIMTYIPQQNVRELRPYELRLIKALREDPRASPGELARRMGASVRFVANTLNSMLSKGDVRVIPQVDLSRLKALILAIFSKGEFNLMDPCRVLKVSSDEGVVDICFVHDLKLADGLVKQVKKSDISSKVMIVTNFQVKSAF